MYSHCICLPETGITLFVIQKGYVHLTARRHLHCRCYCRHRRKMTAFPSRIPPSANDVGQRRAGGEPTRRYVVQSPSPPDRNDVLVPSSFCVAPPMATAVIGGCHCSLVIVPFLQTVAVIVLVLLLPPERTPIPDHDSCPRRETYDDDGRHHRRRDSRHVRRPLKVACMRTSFLPSFYALFNFFPVGIAMIVQPRCWRSESPYPRPIPIPTGGTLRPPRGRIPPSPFRGGTRTRPRRRRASPRCPQSLLSSSSPPSSSSS
jgi:hypothetical protein